MTMTHRFPILGGWKSNFYLGYNLSPKKYLSNIQNTNTYVLRQSFYIDIHDLVSDEYVLKVVLPEGAHDISCEFPFVVDEVKIEQTFSYLDTIGRPTLVIKKKIVS